MTIFVLPQLIYLYPFLFILLLPPVGLNLLYILFLVPANTNRIPRDTVTWKMHILIQGVLCIPALIVASACVIVSRLAMLFFGYAYCILNEDAWSRYYRNLRVIEPYCHGPPLLLYFEDIVSGVAGMVHRRGLLEFTSSFSLSEWFSYYLCLLTISHQTLWIGLTCIYSVHC
jgi:hypothetical protein